MSFDINNVVVFLAVVDAGSFAEAAVRLALPASSVSKRIAKLEQQLDSRLFVRTTRRLSLTEAGRAYADAVANVPQILDEGRRSLSRLRVRPGGVLKVTCPPDDGGFLWRIFEGFLEHCPDVDLDVTHTLDYVDLVGGDVDVALRGGSPPDSTELAARLIVEGRFVLVASPRYLARRGTPRHVAELEAHDGLGLDRWAPNAIRELVDDDGRLKVTFRNRIRANSQETLRRAAIAGLGIAPMVSSTCQADLDAGRLVEVLEGALPGPARMYVVFAAHRSLSAAAQAFVDYASAA